MQSVVVAVLRSVLTLETAKKLGHVWIAALAAASGAAVARKLHGEKGSEQPRRPRAPWRERP